MKYKGASLATFQIGAYIRLYPKTFAKTVYLSHFYQVHITDSSPVAEHCSTISLSDSSDADLKQSCSHIHDQKCDQCTSLASALSDIEKLFREISFSREDDRDEAFFIYKSANLAIHAWKCRLLRNAKQDQARLDALDRLDGHTVLLVNDWAMKFVPQKYRESQSDWFGKRRISWHISVAYRNSFKRRASSL